MSSKHGCSEVLSMDKRALPMSESGREGLSGKFAHTKSCSVGL